MDLDRWESRALLSLPGEPVPGTMTLSPRRDRAAVVVGDAGGRAVLAWWTGTSRPFALLPVPDDAGAPVFVEDGRVLAVPSRGGSEVRFLDLDRARERGRALMVGRPIQLAAAPEDGAAWALCEDVGHVAVLDSLALRTTARMLLEGVDPSVNRLAFSPEGRLAAVAEGRGGGVALLDADPSSPGCGLLLDRLELGRVPEALAWSPLGDELYVVDALLGAVAAISVDRAGRGVKDTDAYLLDQLRSRMERERRKNPLFPP
jgi:sugar lactone lactonase YvrE